MFKNVLAHNNDRAETGIIRRLSAVNMFISKDR